ncbi:MAG TPA: DUF5686 family protein, partial [Candidatus Kapabacteria bacterium]|nr:DUF5686 family protein [Candidatus Kapabacteria bacterium]
IAEKKKKRALLHTYQFDAYSRLTIYSDKDIVGSSTKSKGGVQIGINGASEDSLGIQGIMETYSTAYWDENKGMRSIITQRRQTANIPGQSNFNNVFDILDFNDDIQKLGKYEIAGPTSPDALDDYNYELMDVTELNGKKIYRLRMTPKSDFAALWDGIVSIADSTWDVVEVDVRPNAVVNFPFFDSLHYTQRFTLVDNRYWMPSDIVLGAYLKVNLVLTSILLRADHSSVLSNYVINQPIPDTIFNKPEVIADSSASKFDTTYWRDHEVLPLTGEEQRAYTKIDSVVKTDTGKKDNGPSLFNSILGFPFTFTQPPFTGFGDVYHFNRVEGHYLGLGLSMPWEKILPATTLTGKFGYGFEDKKSKYSVALSQNVVSSDLGGFGINGAIFQSLDHREDGGYYNTTDNTFLGLLDKEDYFNYYYTRGWNAGISAHFKDLDLSATYLNEKETSAPKNTDFSLLFPHILFRANPAIDDGTMRRVQFRLTAGDLMPFNDNESSAGISLESEVSDASTLKSDFTFTRYSATAFTHLRTSSFGFLDARIQGGIAIGALPPQRLFDAESQAASFGAFGVFRAMGIKEYSGDKILAINAEENLGTGLFLLTGIPFLVHSGMEFLIDGGAAWTDISNRSQLLSPDPVNTAKQVYAEAGFGINRILTFLRCDFTWRLTHRYNSGNFAFTVTAAIF